MMAAGDGCNDIVTKLIDAGADINIRNDKGLTALMMALRYGYLDTVQILLNAGKSNI